MPLLVDVNTAWSFISPVSLCALVFNSYKATKTKTNAIRCPSGNIKYTRYSLRRLSQNDFFLLTASYFFICLCVPSYRVCSSATTSPFLFKGKERGGWCTVSPSRICHQFSIPPFFLYILLLLLALIKSSRAEATREYAPLLTSLACLLSAFPAWKIGVLYQGFCAPGWFLKLAKLLKYMYMRFSLKLH